MIAFKPNANGFTSCAPTVASSGITSDNFDTIFSKNSIRYFYKKSSWIIPNGIDINSYTKMIKTGNTKPFTFIIVGRLEHMKNHKFLINIVNELRDYEFKLKIVGTGISL